VVAVGVGVVAAGALLYLNRYEREMLARSSPRVLASRKAAQTYHCDKVLSEPHGIAGVDNIYLTAVKHELVARQVGAWSGANLDTEVAAAIARVKVKAKAKAEAPNMGN
jgi:hypothetical protein